MSAHPEFDGRQWRQGALPFALCAGVALVAYASAVEGLADVWWNSYEFGHGILVLPIIVWALWTDRGALRPVQIHGWWPGLIAVAGCSALWVLSRILGVLVGEQTALMLMLPAFALTFFGPRATWAIGFAFAFPFVASPLWWLINPWLQESTAAATTHVVRALGVPLFREGNYLTIPHGRFLVAEVCSGLRFLLASISLCGVYAFMNIRSVWLGLSLVGAGLVLSVLTNWVRVIIIVVVGHETKMQHAMIEDHIAFGWIVFALSIVPRVRLGNSMAARAERNARTETAAAGPIPGRVPLRRSPWLLLPAVALVLVGPLSVRGPDDAEVAAFRDDVLARAEALPVPEGYRRVALSDDMPRPVVPGVDAQFLHGYRSADGESFALFVSAFAAQRQGAEVVNDWNKPYDLEVFEPSNFNQEGLVVRPREGLAGDQTVVAPLGQEDSAAAARVLWTFHRVAGAFGHGDLVLKLRQLEVLGGAPESAFTITVATPLRRSWEDTERALGGFLMALEPGLVDLLEATESRGD